MIRIIIAEYNTIVRAGLVKLLNRQSDVMIVREAGDGMEVISLLEGGLQADIVVANLNMPKMDGLELTRALTDYCSGPGVIILTMHVKRQFLEEAEAAGARGYVFKHSDPVDLLAAVRSVAAGQTYFRRS